MATTAQIIFCRETRSQVPPGATYPTVGDANAVIARLLKHSGQNPGGAGKRTYDVVAVQVPLTQEAEGGSSYVSTLLALDEPAEEVSVTTAGVSLTLPD